MISGLLPAIIVWTFAAAMLLAWSLVFDGVVNRRKILFRSTYTLLPITLILIFLDRVVDYIIPFSIISVALEEVCKIALSRTCKDRDEAFALVGLFGIWEIVISKAPLTIWRSAEFSNFVMDNIFVILIMTASVALMHFATAAIYAYFLKGKLIIQFLVCFIIHISVNTASYFYIVPVDGKNVFDTLTVISVGVIMLLLSASLSWYAFAGRQPQHDLIFR